jgi:hypothetical protein
MRARVRVRRASTSLAIVIGVALAFTHPVHAEPIDNGSGSVQVQPVTSYPVVTQGSASYGPAGLSANAQSASSSGSGGTGHGGYYYGPTYTYTPIPQGQVVVPGTVQINSGQIVKPTGTGQAACPPGQTGYYVYDGGGNYLGVVCVSAPAGGPAGGPVSPPGQLAQQASDNQPWPSLVLSINPGTGLTGLPSWFWLGGGSPNMPDATATAGPLTVIVHAALAGVTWAFGDGSQLDTTDLGQAYPQPSDVNHEYQADSSALPSGYQVVALLRFKVTYSVNGGPWLDLGIKVRGYGSSYVVNQLQPEAVQ